jgi:hypothetical protein
VSSDQNLEQPSTEQSQKTQASSKDKEASPQPPQSPKPTTADTVRESSETRSISFKVTKTKKDTANQGSGGQYTLINAIPRKKLEKLNYKTGASILEIYKARYKETFMKTTSSESPSQSESIFNSLI